MPDPVTALIGGGASLITGMIGSSASSSAADAQIDASKDATAASIAEQRRQFDISMEAVAPWRQTGEAALNRLSSILGLPGGGTTTGGDPALQPGGKPGTVPGINGTGGPVAGIIPGGPVAGPTNALIGAMGSQIPGRQTGGVNPPRNDGQAAPNPAEEYARIQAEKSALENEKANRIHGGPGSLTGQAKERYLENYNQQTAALDQQLSDIQLQASGLQVPPPNQEPPPGQDPPPGAGDTGQMFNINELRNLPGYQFAQGEGENAMARAMSARGRSRSGAHDKAIMKYTQGLADQNYVNYLNPYFNLAGMGQVSAGQAAGQSQALGNQISNLYQNQGAVQGNARASNYANQGNIWGNQLNNLAGGAMAYRGYP